ncbi:patatin-like phospholipase family protein [Bacteriovorax sp. Seq25_V]|uniref:patatin-like phospholipase family protein n=1 Tax=Bacteriovorax sp. Seq25_V TaxID=1201288 RepID=UPI00038A1FE5|nr:patatin-like phospholipase family protein [Bacteriovorax sp. Seq25_V]EQC43583.1 phospholipase, patatin family [Bacteriovorax sp. Seq25_V]
MNRIDISNFKNKKSALVLSGGVVKAAAWHLGVAWALEELGFTLKNNHSAPEPDYEISTYVGSSAGSLISLYLASGYSPTDIIESFIQRKNSTLKPIGYKDMLSLKKPHNKVQRSSYDPFEGFPLVVRKLLSPVLGISGIFSTQGLHDYISENIIKSNDFADLDADLFVVATQLDHSRKVIFSKYNYPNPGHDSTAHYYTGIPISEAVTASMSVPPFYSPYPVVNTYTGKTDYYIDGEIRETLSTHVASDNNCEFIISSWTHTPYHYQDEIGSLINYGLPAICVQAIYLMIQKKIVGSRARRLAAEDIVNTVNSYMKTHKFDEKHRRQIGAILERKLNYNPNVHLIDIYPKHEHFDIFFTNSFSLDPKRTSLMVKAGYKRTLEIFRNHEFEA